MSENDGITCREGKDGYALVDKAQWEAIQRKAASLTQTIEDYRRNSEKSLDQLMSDYENALACDGVEYLTIWDEWHAMKQSVQKQMAELRAENARLKRELDGIKRSVERSHPPPFSVIPQTPGQPYVSRQFSQG